MADPRPRLDIALADTDRSFSVFLKRLFEDNTPVTSVTIFNQTNDVLRSFGDSSSNALVIDIFTMGVDQGLEIITTLTENFPTVPICLLGTNWNLSSFPEVPQNWKKKFGHYYKLYKDMHPNKIQREVEKTAYNLLTYWLARTAKVRLNDLRKMLFSSGETSTRTALDRNEISNIVNFAEQALEIKEKNRVLNEYVVPGFEAEDIQKLVKETIERASNALEKTANVNKVILVCGVILISVSFVVAIATQSWEAITFGGFGLAGIIASLITNPLKSIGLGARRLVQIQVAYIGFLNQIHILNQISENDTNTILERSIQLDSAIKNIQESLERYFG